MINQIIYTDGSCLKNPGKGGWAFIAIQEECEWLVSGGVKQTTNNRMELLAVIEALTFMHEESNFCIYSDSMYVINCAKGKWKRKKNADLWKEYDKVSCDKRIEWVWVKGHSGNKYNDIVDALARKEATEVNDM